MTTYPIHKKINAKGNLSRWFGPKSFRREAAKAMKSDYKFERETFTGERLYYPQDCKTNHREPGEPDYNAVTPSERHEMASREKQRLS